MRLEFQARCVAVTQRTYSAMTFKYRFRCLDSEPDDAAMDEFSIISKRRTFELGSDYNIEITPSENA